MHSATGVTPFFAVFGQHMYLNGSNYRLARKLRSLSDHEVSSLEAKDRLAVIRDQVKQQLHKAYERSRQRYDQRARHLRLEPGQEVWRRNFVLSNFSKAFNAKFARKFLKSRVVRAVGTNAYELEDLRRMMVVVVLRLRSIPLVVWVVGVAYVGRCSLSGWVQTILGGGVLLHF